MHSKSNDSEIFAHTEQNMSLNLSCCLIVIVLVAFMHATNASVSHCGHLQSIDKLLTCCRTPSLITEELNEKCAEFPGVLNPCYIECLNNETALFDDDYNINESNLKDYLQVAMQDAPIMLPIVEQAFQECATKMSTLKMATEEMNASRQIEQHKCCPKRQIFIGCILQTVFNNCPNTLRADNEMCKNYQGLLKSCANI